MTIERSQGKSLSARADEIFRALQALGNGWFSQGQIAQQMGKKRLNSADVLLLSLLEENGRIEVMKDQARGPIGYTWKYRVK